MPEDSHSDLLRFRVITFDCYGTLIDWESGILTALRPVLKVHGAQLDDPQIVRLYAEIEAEEEATEYRAYKDVLAAVVRGFGARLGFAPTKEEQQSLSLSLPQWEPFPDTVAALHQLKSKFKLGILSNVDDDLFCGTARLLQVSFDYLVTAAQARAYKPSLEMFRLAQSKLGVPPQQWLHAAQSVHHDVIPAQSLGISTVWVNRPSVCPGIGVAKPAAAKPDLEVASLQALADLALKK